MTLGERLTCKRKEKGLSQEEVANTLNVTRQTVSKWELDQSLPDFDKIIPICKLYDITSDELLTGKCNKEKEIVETDTIDPKEENEKRNKRAGGLFIGIFLYFLAIAWIMTSIEVFKVHEVIAAAVFILICGLATCLIVFTQIVYKKKVTEKEEKEDKLYKMIDDIVGIAILIIYLVISFTTGSWYITWIIWIAYPLIMAIVKLIISLGGDKND